MQLSAGAESCRKLHQHGMRDAAQPHVTAVFLPTVACCVVRDDLLVSYVAQSPPPRLFHPSLVALLISSPFDGSRRVL